MITGHTSKAALGAARIALLAGVSAAAIFAANTANAQVQQPPVFTQGDNYPIGPAGFDLSKVGSR